jgi:hexosaminidase
MHLTDDQGWRIAIDKYPALTEKGSKFDTIYHEPAEREGYYTKADIRELIKYAQARNVEIIPEIEMPGHSVAALATYPELSCTGNALAIHPFFKGPMIHHEVLCVGKETTLEFLENVLSEVIELFPSQYVHIGGDEAPKVNWKACPDCQRVKMQNGLKDEDELQSWFIRRMEKFINSKGKKMIGWDEITEGGLSKTATLMFWRGSMIDIPLAAVNQGNDVIMCPTTHCYFDYPNDKITYWGIHPIHPTPTEKVYSYEPLSGKLENIDAQHILGVQADFWSHVARSEPDMDRQIFPRMLALSEVAWTESRNKNWTDFSLRLKNHYQTLDLLNMYFYESKINE